MAKNRIRPYEYKVENGATIAEPQEAEVIRNIYKEYAAGLSYKAIAKALTAEGIRYMPDKPTWNKNMIARILQNSTYLGTEKYPQIIENIDFHSAQQVFKPYTHTESQDIKTLKPLLVCGICGEPIKRRFTKKGVERWYCPSDIGHIKTTLTDKTLLQSIELLQKYLAENPQSAKSQKKKDNKVNIGIIRLQNEIDLAISEPNADTIDIQKRITQLAVQKYALCDDCGDDGAELIKQIAQMKDTKLDSKRLKAITVQIKITYTAAIELVLNNGQIVRSHGSERSEHYE